MNSRVATTFAAIATSLLVLSGCSSGAGAGQEHIDTLAISYTIEASGTVRVVERIDYDFAGLQGKHGIDRFLASRFASSDGMERVYGYDNIRVESPSGASALFSTTLSNALQIRVGNKNATVGGRQSYLISYDIRGALNTTGPDGGSQLDEFYWNATGNSWVVPIDKTTIEVHGPAAIDKIACYSGVPGSNANCSSSGMTGDTATFAGGRILPGEGITIAVAWPSGTFADTAPVIERPLAPGTVVTGGSNDGPDPFWSPWNWAGGLALLLGIPLLFWALIGARRRDQEFAGITPGSIPADRHSAAVQDAPRSETVVVQYQPPKGFPVGAANTVLEKRRKTVDVTATLVELAVRGYLIIEEIGAGGARKAKNYRLTATPDRAAAKKSAAQQGSPGAAELLPHEALLLGKLFKGGRSSITLSDLTNRFAGDMRTITKALDSWIENAKFFVGKVTGTHPLLLVPLLGSVIAFFVMTFIDGAWVFLPIGTFIGSSLALRWSKKAARRSALGHALYLQLEGFRLYISTAEADRVRFDEREDIFSRYMPWAIAFGEAKRWARVFTELAEQGRFTEVPDWYVGNGGFSTGRLTASISSISSIGSAVTSFSAMAASSMTSTPSSSGSSGFSGGGSSGGGSSGGGGGGGGGGSW